MSDQYLGEIRMVGFNFAPAGWALCNGQTISIAQNAALFSLLGTYYGGDGIQTFQLPNLQGRFPLHQGTGVGLPTYVIGQSGGTVNTNILTSNLPSHSHLVNASSNNADQNSPVGSIPAATNTGGRGATLYPTYTQTAANGTMLASMIQPTGNNAPLSILNPYLTINFIIALTGIFPSRN